MLQGESNPQISETNDQNESVKSDQQYSYHHIIPACKLIELLKETKKLDIDDRKKIINEYLNREHIKDIIIGKGLINYEFRGRKDHGLLIAASFVNNPNNLVYGPGYNRKGKPHRGNEKKDKKDIELAALQSNDHKEKIRVFEERLKKKDDKKVEMAVKAFGEIPQARTVNFEKYAGSSNKDRIKDKYYAITTELEQ